MLRELFKLSQYLETVLPPMGYGRIEAQICIDVTKIVTATALVRDFKGKQELGKKLNLPSLS